MVAKKKPAAHSAEKEGPPTGGTSMKHGFQKGQSGNIAGRPKGRYKPLPKTPEELQAQAVKDADRVRRWARAVINDKIGRYTFEEKAEAAQILSDYAAKLVPPPPPKMPPLTVDVRPLEKIVRDVERKIGELLHTAAKLGLPPATASPTPAPPPRTEAATVPPVQPAPPPAPQPEPMTPSPQAFSCPPRITSADHLEMGGNRYAVSEADVMKYARETLGWTGQVPDYELASIRRKLAFLRGGPEPITWEGVCRAAGAVLPPMSKRGVWFQPRN